MYRVRGVESCGCEDWKGESQSSSVLRLPRPFRHRLRALLDFVFLV